MIYFWKIVMDNGKEYVVKSPISSTKKVCGDDFQ